MFYMSSVYNKDRTSHHGRIYNDLKLNQFQKQLNSVKFVLESFADYVI